MFAVLLSAMFFVRNKVKSILPHLNVLIGFALFITGLVLYNIFNEKCSIKNSFYIGFAFGLFASFFQHFFQPARFKLLCAFISCLSRFFIVWPDNYYEVLMNIFFDFALILTIYCREIHIQSIFETFYCFKEDLSKFKAFLTSNRPESVIILSKNLEQKLFINSSFLNTFNVSDLPQIKEALSMLTIKVDTLITTKTTTHTNNAKDFSMPTTPSSPSNLLDLIHTYKNNYSDNSSNEIKRLNVEFLDSEEQRVQFEAKILLLKWDDIDSIAIVLTDLTQQATIYALKTAGENKDKVLANVCHELRTPINGILGVMQIIEEEYQDTKLLSYCKTAKVCSQMLLYLVNTILDSSLIQNDSFKLNTKLFKIQDMIEEIEYMFKFQCSRKGLSFDIIVHQDVPSEIISDKNRITQIIVNLLANALKFTCKGHISLTISKGKDEDEIEFVVEDTGMGIKEEDKTKLFKAFGKLDQVDPNINTYGVGLGLNISNGLVKLLNPNKENAKIEFKSEFGRGTTFAFKMSTKLSNENPLETENFKTQKSLQKDEVIKTLKTVRNDFSGFSDSMVELGFDEGASSRFSLAASPLQTFSPRGPSRMSRLHGLYAPPQKINYNVSSPREESSLLTSLTDRKESSHPSNGDTVLVVDDNALNLMIVSRLLQKHNLKVITALNGKEAIQKIKIHEPPSGFKIIFMDCQMPVMNGFETTKILKEMMQRNEIKKAPIYALTASEAKKDREDCLKAGMSGYLTKPLKGKEILELVENPWKSSS